MINVNRADCPAPLGGGSRAKDRYARQEVVDALHKMQHKKCCYCEHFISGEGHGKAVEHFAPKAVFKARRNDWDNLLLACAQCNGKKSDDYPILLTDEPEEPKVIYISAPTDGEPLLLDPSDSANDPEEHLQFVLDDRDDFFGLICEKNDSDRGRETINVIGLDREFYTKAHRDHLIELSKDYMTLLSAKNNGHEAEVRRCEAEFRMRVSARSKLAAVARAFAKEKKLDERFEVPIPKGASE